MQNEKGEKHMVIDVKIKTSRCFQTREEFSNSVFCSSANVRKYTIEMKEKEEGEKD